MLELQDQQELDAKLHAQLKTLESNLATTLLQLAEAKHAADEKESVVQESVIAILFPFFLYFYRLSFELNALQQQLEEEKNALLEENGNVLKQMSETHAAELTRLHNEHQAELDQIHNNHANELDQITGNHANEIEQLRAEYQDHLNQLGTEHQSQIEQLVNDNQAYLNEATSTSAATIEQLTNQLNEVGTTICFHVNMTDFVNQAQENYRQHEEIYNQQIETLEADLKAHQARLRLCLSSFLRFIGSPG